MRTGWSGIERESRFYERLDGDVVRCLICARKCYIKPGGRGFCYTKENRGGRMYTLIYGELTAMAVDPIEKKPLNHFYPGSLAFSISSFGCSFRCPWCQNWHLSMAKPGEVATTYVEPERVVEMAKKEGCVSIAYTYNEPIISLDYVYDTARIARREGVKNVLVTNGYISMEALEEVVPYIDAVNVDWKAFNEKTYRRYCKGQLQPVLNATEEMKRRDVHVEVTNLIIPGVNDDPEEIRSLARYLVDHLGPDTPLHITRFFPYYKFSLRSPTPVETLVRAREMAMEEGVKFVYVGNVPGEDYDSTFCPSCGKVVIKRFGYDIIEWNLTEDMRCKFCGEKIPIVGAYQERGFLRW